MSNDAIATITVRNYRCFGDQGATIELRPGFTAFVGPNNSGKSILLRIHRELRPMLDQMKFTGRGANVLPVRYIADIYKLLNFACGNAMTLFARVLGFYRNGELTAFSRQYIEEWRDAYRSIPHALVEYQKLVNSLAK